MHATYGAFGGNLSVRKPPDSKPLMIFGQDKSVYNQFLIGNHQWVGPQGQHPLLPKTDGISFMVSALQSHETGFGVNISEIQFNKINEACRGCNYVNIDAAMAIHGQATKKDLKHSPFVVYFELGANNEGYWTYKYQLLQEIHQYETRQLLSSNLSLAHYRLERPSKLLSF